MKRLALIVAFAALLAIVLFWRSTRRADFAGTAGDDTAAGGGSKIENRKSKNPAVDVSELAQELNSPPRDIHADLRIVATIIDTYRTNFLREGNPTGTNAEITATLMGRNKHRLVLISPHHPAINGEGELCDRWGTPFFFHAESGTQMGIRSAGPDQKLHTADDVVLDP